MPSYRPTARVITTQAPSFAFEADEFMTRAECLIDPSLCCGDSLRAHSRPILGLILFLGLALLAGRDTFAQDVSTRVAAKLPVGASTIVSTTSNDDLASVDGLVSADDDDAIGDDDADAKDDLPANLWTRPAGEDWPWFLGPNRDSRSPEQGILKDWSGEKLRVVWKLKLNESYGIGSISRGRFIQMDRIDDEEVVICLNAETGETIWRKGFPVEYVDLYGYNGGPRCSPVIDGERVYTFGVRGDLRCLETESGEQLWHIDTEKEYAVIQNFFGVGSTPVIDGNLLIVMVGGSDEASQSLPPGRIDRAKGNGSGIVAFNKLTGEEVYRITDELASYASLQLATIKERKWCFALARGGLIGFDPQTGKVDFQFPWRARSMESVNASTPVVIEDQVFISETYGPGSALLRVKPGGYDIVWQDDSTIRDRAMQTHWNTCIEHKGYLYGSSGRHAENAELRCIEMATGKVMWTQPRLTRCSLMLVDEHFVVQGEYGQLFLIRANPEKFDFVTQAILAADGEGTIEERGPLLKHPAWAAPVLSHGLLYVRGDDALVCLELIPE